MMTSAEGIVIVEVGPRDGFQPIGPFIPTETKIALIRELYAAGIRRMEATAFVSEKAVPQLVDAKEIVAASQELDGLDIQILVPSERYASKALDAGVLHLSFVLSASESHNMSNVRRTTADSASEFSRVARSLSPEIKLRLNVATAFDCPFEGSVCADKVLRLLEGLLVARDNIEVALCDTTGRVTPDRVSALFEAASDRFPGCRWAFHGHDTYGLGVANALAAYKVGVRVMDSSFAGLGGCPFAPGATGNIATEDLVWTADKMGIISNVNLEILLNAAEKGAVLPGASAGGRVRTALLSRKLANGSL
jgi:hydroxymethylglutaryl-CoA lyase